MHGKLRRHLADASERPFMRSHSCDGPFEGAQGVVWRQAAQAEGSTAGGGEAATYVYFGASPAG
eukprot:5799025-Pyramimonas_sp.AAC.1